MMDRVILYQNISRKVGKGVTIDPNLCFYSPTEVLKALTDEGRVKDWLIRISNHYVPPKRKLLLIYPCSRDKPYNTSRSYKLLYSTLAQIPNWRSKIQLMTISEPFGLVPEQFYGKFESWYDCPGLFEWWCRRYGLDYSYEDLDRCIELLSDYIANFLKKAQKVKSYDYILGFVRTHSSSLSLEKDHTHRRMLERAAEKSGVDIELSPSKELIHKIVTERGRLAWDMYGVAHPLAQKYLLEKVRSVFCE
jgi:archaeosine synthase